MHCRRRRSFVGHTDDDDDDDDDDDEAKRNGESTSASAAADDDEDEDSQQQQQQQHHALYAILHLPQDADVALIQRHFKLLSRVYHPDKIVPSSFNSNTVAGNDGNSDGNVVDGNDGDGDDREQPHDASMVAQEAFVAIKAAADILSDPVYRLAYKYGGMLAVTLVKRSQAHQQQRNAATTTVSHRNDDDNDNDDNDEQDNSSTTTDDDDDDDLYKALQQAAAAATMEAMQLVRHVVQEYEWHQQNAGSPPAPHWNATGSFPSVYNEHQQQQQQQWHRDGAASSLAVHGRYHPWKTHASVSTTVSASATTEANGSTSVTVGTGIDGPLLVRGTRFVADGTVNLATGSTHMQLRTQRQTAAGTVVVAALGGPFTTHTPSLPRQAQAPALSNQWNLSFLSYRNVQWHWHRSRGTVDTTPTTLQVLWRLATNVRGQLRHVSLTVRTVVEESMPVWRCRLALAKYPFKLSWKGSEDKNDTDHSNNNSNNNSSCFYVAGSWAPPQFWRAKVLRIHRVHVVGSSGQRHTHQHHHPHHWTVKYGVKFDSRAWMSGNPLWTILCTLETHSLTLRLPIELISRATTTTPVVWMISLLWAEWVDQHVLSHLSSFLVVHHKADGTHDVSRDRDASSSSFHSVNNGDTTRQCYRSVMQRVAAKKRQEQPCRLVIVAAVLRRQGNDFDSNTTNSNNNNDGVVTDLLQFCVTEDQLHLSWTDPRWHWCLPSPALSSSSTTLSHQNEQQSSLATTLLSLSLNWIQNWRIRLGLGSDACTENEDQGDVNPLLSTTMTTLPPPSTLYIRYQYDNTLYEVNVASPSSPSFHQDEAIHLPHAHATALGPCDRVS